MFPCWDLTTMDKPRVTVFPPQKSGYKRRGSRSTRLKRTFDVQLSRLFRQQLGVRKKSIRKLCRSYAQVLRHMSRIIHHCPSGTRKQFLRFQEFPFGKMVKTMVQLYMLVCLNLISLFRTLLACFCVKKSAPLPDMS